MAATKLTAGNVDVRWLADRSKPADKTVLSVLEFGPDLVPLLNGLLHGRLAYVNPAIAPLVHDITENGGVIIPH